MKSRSNLGTPRPLQAGNSTVVSTSILDSNYHSKEKGKVTKKSALSIKKAKAPRMDTSKYQKMEITQRNQTSATFQNQDI